MPPVAKGKLANDNVYISMTKLHRILRPLRTKTIALADALNQPSIRHVITGGNGLRSRGVQGQSLADPVLSSSSPASYFHPTTPKQTHQTNGNCLSEPFGHLAYIPDQARHAAPGLSNRDPSQLQAAIGLGIAHARLGDKIAAVVSAFSALLKHIYPSKPTVDIVPSLRSLCGVMVGSQIEQVEDEHEHDSFAESEDQDVEAVDQWYEAIPEHLRRFVVTAHAMDLVESTLPLSLPRLWEDILDCCSKHGTVMEIEGALLRLLKFCLGSAPKPMPHADQHFSPRYVFELSQRFIHAAPGSQRGAFTALLLRAIKLCDNRIIWGRDGIRTYLEVNRDAFETITIFKTLLDADSGDEKPTTRLRHWVKLLLDIDFALPPDEDMQDDAFFWVHALSYCAIHLLKKSMNEFDRWRSAALSLGLHAFIRSGDHPSIRDDILEPLRTLSEKIYTEIAASKSNANTLFAIIFPCLDRHYFFEAIQEYARAMREADCLHALESMFLSSSAAFANRCARPNPPHDDPEPLLDDHQSEQVREWRAKAEIRCKSQKSLALHALRAMLKPTVELPRPAPMIQNDMTSPFAHIPKQAHRPRGARSLFGRQRGGSVPQREQNHSPQSNTAGSMFLPHLIARSFNLIPEHSVGVSNGGSEVDSDSGGTPDSRYHSSSSHRDDDSPGFGHCGSASAQGSSGVCYAQPPSWVTDPKTRGDAQAAARPSKYRAITVHLSPSSPRISAPHPQYLWKPGRYDHAEATRGSPASPWVPVEPTPLALRALQKSFKSRQGVTVASSALSRSAAPADALDIAPGHQSPRKPSGRSQVPSRSRPRPYPLNISLTSPTPNATGSNFDRDLASKSAPRASESDPIDMFAADRWRPRISESDPLDMLPTHPPTKKQRLV